jgi:hypothetical protein
MRIRNIVSSISLVLLAGCAATSFQSTWKAPDAQPVAITGKKVVVVAMNVPAASRRAIETSIAQELNKLGAQATPSHEILPSDSTVETAKAKLAADGYDAAWVIKLTNKDKEISSTPGMGYPSGPYNSYWGWGGGYGMYSAPEIRTDIKVYTETLVYSVSRDALVWAGTSVTTNPTNLSSSAGELARIAAAEMKKSGLLQ